MRSDLFHGRLNFTSSTNAHEITASKQGRFMCFILKLCMGALHTCCYDAKKNRKI